MCINVESKYIPPKYRTDVGTTAGWHHRWTPLAKEIISTSAQLDVVTLLTLERKGREWRGHSECCANKKLVYVMME